MKSYFLMCRKDSENINPRVSGTSNGKVMILSKCATCDIKNQDLLKSRSKRTIK